MKILYVEDEKNIRDEMLDILSLDYDDIETAANGQEGLEKFSVYKPDLIISDVQMPVMNGIEMCREILSVSPGIPVILMTAFNEQSYIDEANAIGVKCYIQKPVNINELFEAIESCSVSE